MVSPKYLRFFARKKYDFMLPLFYICSELSPKWIRLTLIWELGFSGKVKKATFVSALNEANEIGFIEFTNGIRCKRIQPYSNRCGLMRVPIKQKKFFQKQFKNYPVFQIGDLLSKINECYPKNLICSRRMVSSRSMIGELDFDTAYVPQGAFQGLTILPPLEQLIYCTIYRWIRIFKTYESVGKGSIIQAINQITSIEHEIISRALDKLAESNLIIREGTRPSTYTINIDFIPEFEDFDYYFSFLQQVIDFTILFEQNLQNFEYRQLID